MATAFDRITVQPEKCGGKPCIRELRITVRRVLELLATYPNRESLLSDYPFLEPEDVQQRCNTQLRWWMTNRYRSSGSREWSSSGPGSRLVRVARKCSSNVDVLREEGRRVGRPRQNSDSSATA